MSTTPASFLHRALLGGIMLAVSCVGYAEDAPSFSIVVKPLVTDGKVTALEVRQTFSGDLPAEGRPLVLRAPLGLFGVKSIADQISGLQVTDAEGKVALAVSDDPTQAGPVFGMRRWRALRKAVMPVSVQYRIATQPAGEGGPPYGMKSSGAGVAGRGSGFLVLPENTTSRFTRFAWDLSALPPGSQGVITAGAGETIVPGPPSEVATQWMLAGPARVFNSARSPRFHIYLLGVQPFDAASMIDWADRGYATLARTMKYLGAPEYRLFFRALDVPSYATGTGREAGGGALMTAGNTLGKQSVDDVKTTVFHEMAHQWVGDLSGAGVWFVEGLTTYLTAVLPCQYGMAESAFCANGINNHAADYYGSKARNWSLARIDAAGSNEESVRRVPYGRGMLYFGLVNTQLLEKSGGRRTVLDMLAPMFAARTHGVRLDEAAWEAALVQELGQSAVNDFRAYILDGSKTLVPPSGAFGACLTRKSIRMETDRQGEKVDGYEWQPISGCHPG
jgi:hypothetical protein